MVSKGCSEKKKRIPAVRASVFAEGGGYTPGVLADVAVAVAFFAISVAGDVFSILWQDCREHAAPKQAGGLSVALGALTWLPVVALVATENWLIVVADLAGNYLGSYAGVRWLPTLRRLSRRFSVDASTGDV